MLQYLETKTEQEQKLARAVISTLAFFSLYHLPLSNRRIFELLLGTRSTQAEVDRMLDFLAQNQQIVQEGNLYGLKKWDPGAYNANQLELTKKWQKIDRYFNWLSILPFVRQISVINSLALGTADSDSDIDFFVVTKPNRLYFVRTMIIVLFRLLGVYKTRQRIKDRFCFGFFVAENSLSLNQLLIKPEDPYFVFWLANMRPVLGEKDYLDLIDQNLWIRDYFPNFEPINRLTTTKQSNVLNRISKVFFEILMFIPAMLTEPILCKIHINHTFKLSENKASTSTTIANKHMLKLHGYDVRAEVAYRYQEILDQNK